MAVGSTIETEDSHLFSALTLFSFQTLITDEDVKTIRLDLDPNNPYLRIRPRYGNENDRSKSNFMDTKLRLQDIARLEVGRDKTKRSSASGKKPIKFFSIMLRSRSKQYRTFNFEAESVADRDLIISAIKTLLEQARSVHKSRKSEHGVTSRKKKDALEAQRRGQSSAKMTGNIHERSVIDRRNDSCGSDSQTRSSSDEASREKSVEQSLSGHTSYSGSGSSGTRSSGTGSSGSRSSATRSSAKSGLSHNNDRVKDAAAVVAAKREMMAEGYGCNPFGCSSQALVEDAELAAKLENHTNGPWCADDICAAGFKEFNETVTGIFGESAAITSKSKKQSTTSSTANGSSMTSLLWNSPAPKPQKSKRRPQNRAKDPSAKVKRWNALRFKMTFEGADVSKDIPYLKTIRSCDEYDKRQKPSYESFKSNAFKTLNRQDSMEEELYYDSDPEDTRECTFKRLGPRGVLAERENEIKDDSIIGRRRPAATMTPLYNRRMRKVDENIILDIIENLKNQRLTLMWHPEQTEKNQNHSPVCVKVWIESGIYLVDGTFLLPKLTWLPIHEGNANSFVMNASSQTPEALDMLDVCRVRECETIDRDVYPFASVERSFIIQTQSAVTLFETRSKQDRNHMVNGLKLVIARLASLLMLRDLRAVDEFFGGNSVPGEAPWWAKRDSEEGGAEEDRLPTNLP